MELVIDELRRTQKYHLRQLEENLQKIKSYEESIETLKKGNENHRQTLEQIGQALEILEKDSDLEIELPFENNSMDSITQKLNKNDDSFALGDHYINQYD